VRFIDFTIDLKTVYQAWNSLTRFPFPFLKVAFATLRSASGFCALCFSPERRFFSPLSSPARGLLSATDRPR